MRVDPIEIVCGVDENYAPHLGVLLASISRTNKGDIVRVHILHDGVSEPMRSLVAKCAPAIKLRWYEVINHQALDFEPLLQITRATYLRLTMIEVLPNKIKRALYLDVDMIVNTGLRSLWEINLENNLCAAVTDPGIDVDSFALKYSLPSAKNPLNAYFNAGVILIDLEKVRAQNLLQAAVKLLGMPDAKYELADQDALNIVFWNNWLSLDPAWNFQRKFLYDNFSAWRKLKPEKSSSPKIIHFTEQDKPWKRSEWHPFAWLYIRHLKLTPFASNIIQLGSIDVQTRLKWWLRYLLMKLSRPL